jgi:hypothetical protein
MWQRDTVSISLSKQRARFRLEVAGNGAMDLREGRANIKLRLLGASLPQGIFPGQKKKGPAMAPSSFAARSYVGCRAWICKCLRMR